MQYLLQRHAFTGSVSLCPSSYQAARSNAQAASSSWFPMCTPVQALIHKSELSWDRVMRPEQVVRPGDVVQCKVTSVDQEKARVQLSLKRMQVPPQNPPLTRWTTPHTQRPDCCASVKPQYQHADDATVPLHWGRAGCCNVSHGKLGHAIDAWALWSSLCQRLLRAARCSRTR
jgi:S1 RNA binding domain